MTSRTLFSPEPAKGWLPWGALAPFLCILMVALPVLAFARVEELWGLVDAKGQPLGLAGLYFLLFVEFAATGVVLWAWVRFVERRPLATLGLIVAAPVRPVPTLGRGLLLGFATSGAVVASIGLAGGYDASVLAPAFGSARALVHIALLLVAFVVQAGVEEIVFRGWLLSAVTRKFNLAWGVALSSLVFTLLHYGPDKRWEPLLGTLLFAVFASALVVRSGNLWSAMGWHAGWNWLIAVGFEVPITGLDANLPALLVRLAPRGPDWLHGGAEGPEGSVLFSGLFLVAIGFLAWRGRKAKAVD
jgi:membrane protease YdiL (CAAX protease family)